METPTKLDTTDRTIPNYSAAASTTLSSENKIISQNQIKGKAHILNNAQPNIPSAEPFNKRDMLFYFPVYDAHPVHHIHFDATVLAILYAEDE